MKAGGAEPRKLPLYPDRASPRWWVWVLVGAAIFVLAQAGVALTPQGGSVAVWWPAAGVSAWFILRNPRSNWASVALLEFVVTAAANAVAGRDVDVAFAFGFANAIEILVFAELVYRRQRAPFLLRSVQDAWRFMLAVLGGSALLGVLVAAAVAPHLDDVARIASHAAASHAAAILMIAPFAVLPPRIPRDVPWFELVAQATILGGVLIFLVLAGAGLPLTFLPVGILAWGAFQFPKRAAYVETIIVAVVLIGATVLGRGPFSAPDLSPDTRALLALAFVFMTASYTLFLTTVSYQLRANGLAARNYAELVTSGFVDARVGLLILDTYGGGWRVLLANTAARTEIGSELGSEEQWRAGRLYDLAAESLHSGQPATFETTDGRLLNVDASRISGGSRVAVQIIDVTTSVRATQERLTVERARAATLAAQLELERRQVDFVATASHELRTPTASIAGYLELIDEEATLSPQEREWLEVALRNTERLIDLIDDVLVLARARGDEGRSGLIEIVPVSELIEEVAGIFEPAAEETGVSLTIGAGDGDVVGVRTEYVHALGNLVSNAVKFTPHGGTIHVSAEVEPVAGEDADSASPRMVRITVRDTGPGIAPEALEHVLERFYRTPDAEKAHTPGTGLGLAIAHELAQANGGRIEIHSPDRDGVIATLVAPAVTAESNEIPPHGV